MKIGMTFDDVNMLNELRDIEMDVRTKIRGVLEGVGAETVAYLRSLTDDMADPVRPGEGTRRKHPGGWADVTGALANAYAWKVTASAGGFTLELSNSMDYAVYLEARDGLFVLSGVTEDNGPVEQALRRVIRHIAPDWRVVNG